MYRPSLAQWAQRGMFGWAAQAGSAGQYSYVTLWNNSPGPYVLGVYVVQAQAWSAGAGALFQTSAVGSIKSGAALPIYNGSAPKAGVIYAGTSAVSPSIQWTWVNTSASGFPPFPILPMFLLAPNTGLACSTTTADSTADGAFYWVAFDADELLNTALDPMTKYRIEHEIT